MTSDKCITRIKMIKNGPLVVEGAISYIGEAGGWPLADAVAVALCRCGRSESKPFCDGSHRHFPSRLPSGKIE